MISVAARSMVNLPKRIGLVGLLIGLTWASTAFSQNASQVFLSAPRALRQRLARAEKSLAEERFTDAIADLGAILTGENDDAGPQGEPSGQDYFLIGAGGASSSLRSRVLQLIGQLPDKGFAIYELRYAGEGKALLDEALAERSIQKLKDVIRKYFHTEAGYEASMMLGRWQLDEGQALASATTFERLMQSPRARDRFDPDLSLLLAASWKYAGQKELARKTLLDLKQRLPDTTFSVSGTAIRLFTKDDEALVWLDKIIGQTNVLIGEPENQWTLFRGNPSRNAWSKGDAPLLHPRWRALVEEYNDEQIVTQVQRKQLEQGQPVIPSLQPLAVGDDLIMRTPEKVVGIHRRSGKVIWEYPWTESSDSVLPPVVRGEDRRGASSGQRETELSERIWEDWTYGQVSSDGESVFAIDKLGITMRMGRQRLVMQGGMLRANSAFPSQFNQLVALDLKREGALRWAVGDEHGWDERRLAGAFFLGVPLPLDGELFALVEMGGEIRLVVLDAKTGALQWSQQIAHVENRPILLDWQRRLASATPSYADGIVVCPTSAGAVVALDLSSRTLRWGFQYPSTTAPNERIGFETQYNTSRTAMGTSRWIDSTATIAGSRVLLTPIDSNDLHCLDLLTGKPCWPAKRREQNLADMLFVACVHQDTAMLVGKKSIVSLQLADGRESWKKPIELRPERLEIPSGRGYFTGTFYFLPLANSQLIKIDVAKGEIVERIPTSGVLGNLVAYRDEIISLGLNHLSVHSQVEPLRKKVNDLLAKDPKDPWALARRGELFLHEQKPREAFESLLNAQQAKPNDDAITELLVESFLAALESDFPGMRTHSERVEPWISQPEHRMRFLRLQIAGYQKLGEIGAAFASCLKLADLAGSDPGSFELREKITAGWTLHRDRWLQTRLMEMLQSADVNSRRLMDTTIAGRLKAAIASPSPNPLRQFVSLFDGHELARDARLVLADRLLGDNDHLEAELLLLPLADASDVPHGGAANALLLKLYERVGFYADAAQRLQRIAQQWPKDAVARGKTGAQLLAELPQDSPIRPHLAGPVVWPDGMTTSKEVPNDAMNFPSPRQPSQFVYVRDAAGRISDQILEFDAGHGLLTLRDKFGAPVGRVSMLHSMQTNAAQVTARSYGHLLMFTTGVQPLAVDVFRAPKNVDDALLWPREQPETGMRTSLTSSSGTASNPFEVRNDRDQVPSVGLGNLSSTLGPITKHGIIWLGRGLQCLDPISGDVIWSRSDVPSNAEVLGDDEVVVVINKNTADILVNTNEVIVFNTRDGSERTRYQLPEHGGRWASLGRILLMWQDPKNGPVLWAWDTAAQRELWRETFTIGARGTIVGGDEVVIVEPSGRGLVRSLIAPETRTGFQVESENALTAVYAARGTDQYFVFVNRTPTIQPNQSRPVFGGLFVFGRMYSVQRGTGQMLWPAPASLEGLTWSPNQPVAAPFHVFYSHPSSSPRGVLFAVLCVDKKTGRDAFSKKDVPSGTTYEVVVNPEAKSVRVGAGSQTIDVTYTDAPRPPEPPVQQWNFGK